MLDGRRLTFGFEGIYQGTAVLYDRQTGSLWMHMTGECFEGPLAGRTLGRVPTGRHTTWADWLAAHPTTDVMRQEAVLESRAGDRGYFPRSAARSGDPHLPSVFRPTIHVRDDRLPLAELVHGVVVDGRARAYPFRALGKTGGVVEETLGSTPVTVWFHAGSRSVAAFDARARGRTLSFVRMPSGSFEDRET